MKSKKKHRVYCEIMFLRNIRSYTHKVSPTRLLKHNLSKNDTKIQNTMDRRNVHRASILQKELQVTKDIDSRRKGLRQGRKHQFIIHNKRSALKTNIQITL